ncbi:MAG: iron-containing alcohol dehydrogenase [Chloroflexi bacterium]|jgi:maleylacetate reductase|nr:iron-containing alcohol dehydrogenase [Chloroflexota bacterium]
MTRFSYDTAAQKVIFGAGDNKLLPGILDEFGWQRLFLCTSPHLRKNDSIDMILSSLGEKDVAVFDQTASHVPEAQVVEALAIARESACDVVIGLGGGSAIGLAKAVSYELSAGQPFKNASAGLAMPTIAIPTTYAGSEMTPLFGVTRQESEATKRKITKRDVRITPKVALYDPLLTLDLPPQLTASSGVNALAHCIEAVYSKTRNPLSTASALRGIKLISRALPVCVEDGQNLTARSELLEGAHLGGVALATVSMGIHHGTGHVLGGTAGVPHGVANCIVLPHAMHFNADAVPEQLAVIAEAFGVPRNGRSDYEMAIAAADLVREFIYQLDMPQQLREVGVEKVLMPRLARNLLLSKAVLNNPKPVASENQAIAFLEGMW